MDKTKAQAVIKYLQKKRRDTQGNPWGHSTDTCWGLLFLWNCEEVGCGIQAEQGQHRRWSSVSSSKNLNPWWTSWCHHRMVLYDRRLTVQQIANSISSGLVHTVLTEILGMSKLFARWVPRMLTPEYKEWKGLTFPEHFWLTSRLTLRISTAD